MYTILLVIHTILVLFLIGMVLLQRTDSDGLGGLGGGGGNQFMTGRGAANFMTRTTAILATAFMITSLVLAVMANRMTAGSVLDAVPAADESAPATTSEKITPEKTEQKTETKAKPKAAAPAVPKPE